MTNTTDVQGSGSGSSGSRTSGGSGSSSTGTAGVELVGRGSVYRMGGSGPSAGHHVLGGRLRGPQRGALNAATRRAGAGWRSAAAAVAAAAGAMPG